MKSERARSRPRAAARTAESIGKGERGAARLGDRRAAVNVRQSPCTSTITGAAQPAGGRASSVATDERVGGDNGVRPKPSIWRRIRRGSRR